MILVNLLPADLRRKEAPKINMPELPVKKTLLIAGALVLSAQILMSLASLFYSVRIGMVRRESSSLDSELIDVRKIKSRMTAAGMRLKEIKGLTDRDFYWASLLNELSATVSRGIWLRSLAIEKSAPPAPAKPVKRSEDATKAGSVKRAAASAPADSVSVLVLEGSCTGGAGQETALIGKYLQSLRDNAFFSGLFGKQIDLSNIVQRKVGDLEVYDFMVRLRFKKGRST